ncbi:MAG TPA: hypothetical protein PLH91_00310, partial [Tenuifilaceae bacterium]|nr:hypothetical protein [Tenuifilaceae bacterium]
GLILFPLMYIVQTLIFALIVKDGLITLAYFVSLPLGAFVVYHWRRHFIKFGRTISVLRFIKAKPDKTKRINELFAELYSSMESLVS